MDALQACFFLRMDFLKCRARHFFSIDGFPAILRIRIRLTETSFQHPFISHACRMDFLYNYPQILSRTTRICLDRAHAYGPCMGF